jgi:hypothetical protein
MTNDTEEPSAASLSYAGFVDDLARKNSEALSYIPRPKLEHYDRSGQIIVELENGDPCGFLIHGRSPDVMKVYQACVCYDARRWQHGLRMVDELVRRATRSGCSAIRLRCAADLDANAFWTACGFNLVKVELGGVRRGRTINVYRMDLNVPRLFPA